MTRCLLLFFRFNMQIYTIASEYLLAVTYFVYSKYIIRRGTMEKKHPLRTSLYPAQVGNKISCTC